MSSSGNKINYSIRPRKNIERKIFGDILRSLTHFGNLSDYRYIGFGSFYFQDFILFHDEFAINNCVSFEVDKAAYAKSDDVVNSLYKYITSIWDLEVLKIIYMNLMKQITEFNKENDNIGSKYREEYLILCNLAKRISNNISDNKVYEVLKRVHFYMKKGELFDYDAEAIKSKLADKLENHFKMVLYDFHIKQLIDLSQGAWGEYDEKYCEAFMEKYGRDKRDEPKLNDEIIRMCIEDKCINRYLFNKPYECIDIQFVDINSGIKNLDWENTKHSIVWLDYDEFLSEDKLETLQKVVELANEGNLVIISVPLESNADDFYDLYNENFSESERAARCGMKKREEIDPKKLYATVYELIDYTIREAVGNKNDAIFTGEYFEAIQLLNFVYTDGRPMYTYAMILDKKETKDETFVSDTIVEELSRFEWFTRKKDVFVIDMPNLTNKEIDSINRMLPGKSIDEIANKLPFIDKREVAKYVKVYRYYPRFADMAHII